MTMNFALFVFWACIWFLSPIDRHGMVPVFSESKSPQASFPTYHINLALNRCLTLAKHATKSLSINSTQLLTTAPATALLPASTIGLMGR